MKNKQITGLYARIRQILEAAQAGVARTVNTTQVVANWLVGREIVEEEQKGKRRAEYGERLIEDLSERLTNEYGRGFAVRNLASFREFYSGYPDLLPILHPPRAKSAFRGPSHDSAKILHAPRAKSSTVGFPTSGRALTGDPLAACLPAAIGYAPRSQSWQPGQLHSNLSWTHYRTLLRVDNSGARAFYEIEAIQNNWAARELERQINSLLYERLALSRDKKGVLRLAKKGQQIQRALDVFKDPVVIEFLGLPESPRLVESKLEEALINNLQAFLLELGKGFAFVARQERISLDGDHFYIDLVFYHAVLKCYVLIDLLVGKLTHEDIGQLQLYVNYYDEERRTPGDNPTLGLILCTDKNDAVVRYTLGPHQQRKIFASRYKLHLPTEAELEAEIRRELKQLKQSQPKRVKP
jgi:predicted nuclease of restriction endonuclease-like (RecB) superfamily